MLQLPLVSPIGLTLKLTWMLRWNLSPTALTYVVDQAVLKDIFAYLSICFSTACFATFSNFGTLLCFHSSIYFLFTSLIYFVVYFCVAFYHTISKYTITIKMCDLL
jgi:hypothetical protein